MILAITRMKVADEKRMELSQAVVSLAGLIRQEKGCRRCDLCHNIDDANQLLLLEEWEAGEDLKKHLKSEHFRVLHGVEGLLATPCERTFHKDFSPDLMEE